MVLCRLQIAFGSKLFAPWDEDWDKCFQCLTSASSVRISWESLLISCCVRMMSAKSFWLGSNPGHGAGCGNLFTCTLNSGSVCWWCIYHYTRVKTNVLNRKVKFSKLKDIRESQSETLSHLWPPAPPLRRLDARCSFRPGALDVVAPRREGEVRNNGAWC